MTIDKCIQFHREMYIDMAKYIASKKRVINIEKYKTYWCKIHSSENIKLNCFACHGAEILRDSGVDYKFYPDPDHERHRCDFCIFDWNSPNHDRHYQCEHNVDSVDGLGLHMRAKNLKRYPYSIENDWKKQCKLCYKIATLPLSYSYHELCDFNESII